MEPGRVKVASTRAELKQKVLFFSLCTRIFVLILSLVANNVIPDHDAGVFKFPVPDVPESWFDDKIETALGGLARWDAQYFLHIAHYGYTYENTLAFFPLFPLATRVFAHVLHFSLGFLINQVSSMLLASVLLNLIFFASAARTLFELSCEVLNNDKIAYIAALFFCINPASIFFTAPYSESFFAFFTFKGMMFYMNSRGILTSWSLGLAACVRSNGIVNFGFMAHKFLKTIFDYIHPSKKLYQLLYFMICELFKFFFHASLFLAPFIMFQAFAYTTFCVKNFGMPEFVKDFGIENEFVMPGSNLSIWCNHSIPFSYSYVQNHYWNVGLFKYYELKQIPNFLLAFPIVYLILTQTYSFLVQNKSAMTLLGFGKVEFLRFSGRNVRPEFFVFAVHAIFLALFCVFFINVQVTTRMIASSCPIVYWFIALKYKTVSDSVQQVISSRLNALQKSHKYTFVETQDNLDSLWKCCVLTEKPANNWSYFLRVYFYLYIVVGTVLFSNFYPWT